MEIGELIHTIRGKLGLTSRQKVPDLIAPPRVVTSKESQVVVKSPKQAFPPPPSIRPGKPGMNEINQFPELKVNPTEFNRRNKN